MFVFLISLSNSSLLVYGNTINYLLIVCVPCTIVKHLCSNSFSMNSLEISVYKIMLSAKRDSFASSFSIWMLSISFSCLGKNIQYNIE